MKQKLNCILLIDDDEPTSYISNMLLVQANCTEHIQIAESGEQALNYLSNSEYFLRGKDGFPCPDIIFLDINMPAMNGWEFLDKYRELEIERRDKLMIIMLTTSLSPDDKIRAENIPEISGFENKPLTIETINRAVKRYYSSELSQPIEKRL